MKDIFTKEVSNEIIGRINKLTHETQPKWGKMDVAQMLGHCNVTYEMDYTNKHPAPNGFVKLMLKLFVKEVVVGAKPYKKNSQTAPAFRITDKRVFEEEKTRLIDYINKVQQQGRSAYEGKASLSFGSLSADQWNNMFYKHLDHHLNQFGV
jgi:hypothetical protein